MVVLAVGYLFVALLGAPRRLTAGFGRWVSALRASFAVAAAATA
jgi:hypothetical protein